jgi:hypothetical protein
MKTQFFTIQDNLKGKKETLDINSFEEFVKVCEGFQVLWETDAIDLYVGDMFKQPLVVFRKEKETC